MDGVSKTPSVALDVHKSVVKDIYFTCTKTRKPTYLLTYLLMPSEEQLGIETWFLTNQHHFVPRCAFSPTAAATVMHIIVLRLYPFYLILSS